MSSAALFDLSLGALRGFFGAIGFAFDGDHLGIVYEPVDRRDDASGVGEDLAPFGKGTALGACPYGVYLLDGIVLSLLFVEGATLVDRFTTDQTLALPPLVAVAVASITPLTYVAIERPFILLGRPYRQGLCETTRTNRQSGNRGVVLISVPGRWWPVALHRRATAATITG